MNQSHYTSPANGRMLIPALLSAGWQCNQGAGVLHQCLGTDTPQMKPHGLRVALAITKPREHDHFVYRLKSIFFHIRSIGLSSFTSLHPSFVSSLSAPTADLLLRSNLCRTMVKFEIRDDALMVLNAAPHLVKGGYQLATPGHFQVHTDAHSHPPAPSMPSAG